ncbi:MULTISPECIES: ABC transporter permease/substrate-binding protein [unclassified Beijerinckia]|uniref:ABC transporter permease/substrate-binding protein n=1 Tax=unclassified Beijerinckia TaxID=2638183 RepID=UPI00089A962E|nr:MULTISPECIES: ABC transporter permease/substrate-binding protein [unclassified Beijerinckia]MDH7796942.1 osmoprotectant transport system permease protein [Beijerinckia sp. GAS462]SEC66075.1 osmoprotectant transport system permease protein [Beijerinckia sp. 28-YEA-48]
MNNRIAEAFALLPHYLSQHILLSLAALVLGGLISIPLAAAALRFPGLRGTLLAVASVIQTIPGLAMLALFYPLLLAISTLTQDTFGFGVPALGFLPSVAALTLYAILPILRNTVTGLTGIDPTIAEAAQGVGMTRRQQLLQVDLPLAAPVIMAGVRLAAVWTIGAATLATPVGQTSLGNYIFTGLQTENWVFVLFGCVAAAVLAILVDLLLALVEKATALRDKRRLFIGVAGLAALICASLVPLARASNGGYVIGAKNFSEQFILAELIAGRLRQAGATATIKEGLGSAVAFRALANDELDVYVDYTGTLWTNVMDRGDALPRDQMLSEMTRWMKAERGVTVLGRLGFENAYVLVMRKQRANGLGIARIDDLARHAGNLTLGSDIEFLDRPEWAALRQSYGLQFRQQSSYNPTFMYRALADGTVDVISAFSSDGRVAADDLTVLEDPHHAVPNYDAVVLIAPKRADDGLLRQALQPLIGAISVEAMRAANYKVDRENAKISPSQAAAELAKSIGLSR